MSRDGHAHSPVLSFNEMYIRYNSLLNDCYNCYFSVRQQHLAPMIVSKIQEMGPSQKDKLLFVSELAIFTRHVTLAGEHLTKSPFTINFRLAMDWHT